MSGALLETNVLEQFSELITLTTEYEESQDRELLKVPEALDIFVNTSLTIIEIAEILEISDKKLVEWVNKFDFKDVRKSIHGKFDIQTIDFINENTVKILLERSTDIEKQIRAMGNRVISKAYKQIDSDELKPRDLMHFALKFKELEAKVTGKMQAPTTNINFNQAHIYKKMVEEGFDAAYTAEEVVEAEVLEVPTPHQLPKEVAKNIDEHKEMFTKLSDEEIEEMLGDEAFGN